METVNVNLLLVIAVITAMTEVIKRKTMKKFPSLASFVAVIFGCIYVSFGKYYFDMYADLNWLNAIILGFAIGFASTGGYENIKNMLTMGTALLLKESKAPNRQLEEELL